MRPSTANNPGFGDKGELWFAAQLPLDWIWQPPRRDVGKDGLIVIRDRSDLHNCEFSVQIKATNIPQLRGDTVSVSGVSTSAVLYWFSSPLPTLFVVVDLTKRRGWFAWHHELFNSPTAISGKKTCTVAVPLANALDSDGWLSIRERLSAHYRNLHRAFLTARMAAEIVPRVRRIADAARDLLWLQREPDRPRREDFSSDDHSAVFLLIHDQECYGDILDSVQRCQSLFAPDTYMYEQLALWQAAFQAHVCMAYPDFGTFRNAPSCAGTEIVFNAPMLKEKREILLAAALEVIAVILDRPRESAA